MLININSNIFLHNMLCATPAMGTDYQRGLKKVTGSRRATWWGWKLTGPPRPSSSQSTMKPLSRNITTIWLTAAEFFTPSCR